MPVSTSAAICDISAFSRQSPPPWWRSARTVATITTTCGLRPPTRQTMSMNFSIPRSAAKPDSVITNSPSLSAIRSAMIELLPCAMFANGPACMKQS